MSMMGELKFFLVFQIKQMKEETFLCQFKYVKDMLLTWPIPSPSIHQWHLMDILISIKKGSWSTKRYFVP
jgi:hypothetical protein